MALFACSLQMTFEETWWESSDWTGMREMGAKKSGSNRGGDAWNEEWLERVYTNEDSQLAIARTAHKCAAGLHGTRAASPLRAYEALDVARPGHTAFPKQVVFGVIGHNAAPV